MADTNSLLQTQPEKRTHRRSIKKIDRNEKVQLCNALHSPSLVIVHNVNEDHRRLNDDMSAQLERARAKELEGILALPKHFLPGLQKSNMRHQTAKAGSLKRMVSNIFLAPSTPALTRRKPGLCPRHAPICHHLLRALVRMMQKEVGARADETIAYFTGKTETGEKTNIIIRDKYPEIDNFLRELRRINSYWTRLEDYRKIYQDDLGEHASCYRYVENGCDGCIVTSIVAFEQNLINLRTAACLRQKTGVKRSRTIIHSGENRELPEIVTWVEAWMGRGSRTRKQDLFEKSEELIDKIKKIRKAAKKDHKRAAKESKGTKKPKNRQRKDRNPNPYDPDKWCYDGFDTPQHSFSDCQRKESSSTNASIPLPDDNEVSDWENEYIEGYARDPVDYAEKERDPAWALEQKEMVADLVNTFRKVDIGTRMGLSG